MAGGSRTDFEGPYKQLGLALQSPLALAARAVFANKSFNISPVNASRSWVRGLRWLQRACIPHTQLPLHTPVVTTQDSYLLLARK